FHDSDLKDGNLPERGGDGSGSNGKIVGSASYLSYDSQGAIAGIVSAVFATVVGAVSSFIAYQKKKLCFKQSGKNS
ncbi:C99L2 protein, partial [Chloroceryle aenea]|nr:C99L2 protein [Chloroceryle aenea]